MSTIRFRWLLIWGMLLGLTPNSLWAVKDYVTIGVNQMMTDKAIEFSNYDSDAGAANAFEDESPDVQQIFFQREIYLSGSKEAPIYLNLGISGLWMQSDQFSGSGLGVFTDVRYGKRVSVALGIESGAFNGTLAATRSDGTTERYERLDGTYSAPLYFKLALEQDFNKVNISLFYIQKDFQFETSPAFPTDEMPYRGAGLSLGFPF